MGIGARAGGGMGGGAVDIGVPADPFPGGRATAERISPGSYEGEGIVFRSVVKGGGCDEKH